VVPSSLAWVEEQASLAWEVVPSSLAWVEEQASLAWEGEPPPQALEGVAGDHP